jgi:hypothetical protein
MIIRADYESYLKAFAKMAEEFADEAIRAALKEIPEGVRQEIRAKVEEEIARPEVLKRLVRHAQLNGMIEPHLLRLAMAATDAHEKRINLETLESVHRAIATDNLRRVVAQAVKYFIEFSKTE